MSDSPDKVVADKIVSEFREKGLIREDRVEDFTRRLSSGNLSVEDWKLMAELAIEETEGSKNAQQD